MKTAKTKTKGTLPAGLLPTRSCHTRVPCRQPRIAPCREAARRTASWTSTPAFLSSTPSPLCAGSPRAGQTACPGSTNSASFARPALGDTLLFSSVLQDLRAHYPESRDRSLLHESQNLAAAEILPGSDRRVVISLTEPPRTIRQFRAERLDALLDFSSWQRLTAFYSLLSGARFTAGFRTRRPVSRRGLRSRRHPSRRPARNRQLPRDPGPRSASPAGALPRIQVPPATGPEPLDQHVADLVVFHLWASGQRSPPCVSGPRTAGSRSRTASPGPMQAAAPPLQSPARPADLPRTEPFVARMQAEGLNARSRLWAPTASARSPVCSSARGSWSAVNTGVMHLAAIAGAPYRLDQRAQPQRPLGTDRPARAGRRSPRRRLRLPASRLQLRRPGDRLHGTHHSRSHCGGSRRSADPVVWCLRSSCNKYRHSGAARTSVLAVVCSVLASERKNTGTSQKQKQRKYGDSGCARMTRSKDWR